MEIALKEQFLAGSGSVSIRYFLAPSEKQPHLEVVLVIRYSGEYPFGSGGNADAIYMHAMAKAAVEAFEPWAVVHDFSELRYEWGDMLEMVFGVGPQIEPSPVAIVVGPDCEEAIRRSATASEAVNRSSQLGVGVPRPTVCVAVRHRPASRTRLKFVGGHEDFEIDRGDPSS